MSLKPDGARNWAVPVTVSVHASRHPSIHPLIQASTIGETSKPRQIVESLLQVDTERQVLALAVVLEGLGVEGELAYTVIGE